jgi:hypothetical protein
VIYIATAPRNRNCTGQYCRRAGVSRNGDLVAGGNVNPIHYESSPISALVVYVADQDIDNVGEIYASFEGTPTYLPLVRR